VFDGVLVLVREVRQVLVLDFGLQALFLSHLASLEVSLCLGQRPES